MGFKLELLLFSTACLLLIKEITSRTNEAFLSANSLEKNYSKVNGALYLKSRSKISNALAIN